MRNAVRKLIGVAMIGALGAFAVVPMLSASAQVSPGACSFSVTPSVVASFPADVVVSGVAPAGVNVQLFENGGATPIQTQTAAADGTFSFGVTVTGPTTFAVNYTFGNLNAYTTVCTAVSGEVVQRVTTPTTTAAPQVQALAFTGSSNTPSYVLIGVAAVVLGVVLVVAARRRSHLS